MNKPHSLLLLLVLAGIAAGLFASISSHRKAWSQMKRMDKTIGVVLADLDPLAADRLDINGVREGYPPLSAYEFSGNSHGHAPGGVLEGPGVIDRDVIVAGGVNLTIETRSDWRFFAGSPYVTLRKNSGSHSDWFIKRLKDELSERGIPVRVITQAS